MDLITQIMLIKYIYVNKIQFHLNIAKLIRIIKFYFYIYYKF